MGVEEPKPIHVYSEVNPMRVNGPLLSGKSDRIAAEVCFWG